jgi:hypothetical protein
MRDQACTARIRAIGSLATSTRLHVEWKESAHGHRDETQVSDVGGFGTLVTAIVVLCMCVLSAVLSAVFMLVS